MTQKELRNTLVKFLAAHIERPVILADQLDPEQEPQYMLYQPVQPYMQGIGASITREVVPGTGEFERDIITRREEEAEGTFSFTACSRNRKTPDAYILGDDEALDLAEMAQGYFLHVGQNDLYDVGIVVVDVGNVLSRSALEIDEVDRRYGFDVRVRYARVDARRDGVLENGTIKHLKE